MFSSSYVWMALPAVVMLLGGVLTFFWHPAKQTISLVQHFAAGIILAVLAVEVFPEINHKHAPNHLLLITFATGALFMFGLKLFGDHLEKSAEDKIATSETAVAKGLNYGFIMTVFVDAAMDGLTIGAGFAAGANVGFALALGLSVEMLFLGMSLISDSLKGRRMLFISVALSLTILTTALLGYKLLAGASDGTVAIALTFSAAALLYLVSEELLIEAHEVEESPFSALVLFAGFTAFWGLQLFS
ncbi:MAG: zinc permease [Burkholderiales bacterium]